MAYDTNYPVTCPIDNKVIYMDDCFERCMSACESAPEYYMPGLRPFEEERPPFARRANIIKTINRL